MASAVYLLCALTAIVCASLLMQAYFARGRYRLLLWSGLCFVGLALNNLLLVVDKLVLPPSIDLSLARTAVALIAMAVLLYGLVMDAE
jgi:hypothetical protein